MSSAPQVEPADDRAATGVLGPASAEAAQPRRVLGALAAIGVAAVLGGFFIGRLGGEDVDAARSAGAAEGARQSTAASERAGYRAGYEEGRKAGYKETYKKAYKTAYDTARSTP
jgi:flagellar biosynthesis/type III secretory pathway protein FliH